MNARRDFTGRLAWIGLAAVLVLACSEDKKTLLLIDVSLAPGVAPPASVTIDVAPVAGGSLGAATFDWSKAKNGILQVGPYLPGGVAGEVKVTATGKTNGVAQSSGSIVAMIEADKTNGPVGLTLQPITVVGDAGVEDSAAAPEADANLAGADVGGLDAPVVDALMNDDGLGHAPEATPGDAPSDTPLGTAGDTPDATLGDVPVAAPGDSAGDLGSDGPNVLAWEPAENVENDPVSRSYNPVVAVEPITENVFVAWYEANKVKVMRYDRKAGTWGVAKTLESRGIPGQVAVGADASGNIIVAWLQQSSSTEPSPGVWVSQSSDGVAWSPPQQLVAGTVFTMSLAVARNGIARLAWSKETGTNQKGLFTAYYDKTSWKVDTAPLLEPTDPASYNPYDSKPQVLIGGTGDGMVVITVRDENGLESVGAVNLTGATRSSLRILDTDTTKGINSENRSAAMNANGEGVVVWPQATSNNTAALNLAYYKPAVGWSPVQKVAAGDEFYTTGVALDGTGAVTVAWVQNLAASGNNVMAIHGTVGGTWGQITPLENDNVAGDIPADYAAPMLAADGSGNVQVAWRKKINASTFGAYARRLQGATWQPQVKLGQKADLKAFMPKVAVADSGFSAVTFVYVSSSGATTDPEANNVEVAFFR